MSGLFNRARVLRDQDSKFSITYDPTEEHVELPRSYEYCRKEIDEARKNGTIDSRSHHALERKLSNARIGYIVFQRTIDKIDSFLN